MMRVLFKSAIYLVTLLILSSCVKVKLDHEDELVLITNWDDRSEGISIPPDYMVRINENETIFQGETNVLTLHDGEYHLLIYNTANEVEITNNTAFVTTISGLVNSKPDWFFASKLQISIPNDIGSRNTAYMLQEIRQLKISLTVINGNIEAITNVKSTLSGVANSMDITTRVITGVPANAELKYERQENKMEASIRLIGIYPSATQILTTEITINGVLQTVETNLTDLLKNFNNNKSTPLTLNANLDLEIPGSEPGFSASIENWEETSEDIEVD